MMPLKYVVEDVRCPIIQNGQRALIIHCVNDIVCMGSGVAKALYEKWPLVRQEYMKWGKSGHNFELGNIQAVKVEEDIAVINMIGQRDIKPLNGIPPIRYGAIRKCVRKTADIAKKYNATVHCPYKMGSDLAGGKWEEIEKILIEELANNDIVTVIYDVFNQRAKGS